MASPARSTARTVRHLPLTKARINLGDVIKRVRINKEYVILEKDGLPVAGLMDIDEFEDYLELQHPKVKRDIAASARDYRAGRSRPAGELLAELSKADRRENAAPRRGRPRQRA
jgi:prevent-host-death family protein